MKIEIGGRPKLVLDDRPAVDRKYRFRAYLQGRTQGGYLNGFGPTAAAAIDALIADYQREIEHVEAGRDEFRRMLAGRRR